MSRTCLFALVAGLVPAVGLAADPPAAVAGKSFEYVGFDETSLSSDARDGLAEIFSGHCFHGGMPLTVIQALARANAANAPKLTYNPQSPEGVYYSTGQIPSPRNRVVKGNLALGDSMFERDGVELVNFNCFACHAGIVNGQVVAGLGNNRHVPANKLAPPPTDPPAGLNAAERKELREFLASTTRPLRLPATSSRGDHFGPFVVWSAGAHLADPERKGLLLSQKKTHLVKRLESTMVPNVDPMPWWLMKYKEKDYWYADGGPADAAHFSFNFTTDHPESNENHAKHVESTRKALAFARETTSPLFPKRLDAALVQRGADLFHGRRKPRVSEGFRACKTCHGTYTKKDSNLEKPGSWSVDYRGSTVLKDVMTDDTYNRTLQTIRPIADHINKLAAYYMANGTPNLTPRFSVPTEKGYVAPPLVGVWASAPYFHNGSVPTIEAVLNSKHRPEIWLRELNDPWAYDLEKVGLKYEPLLRAELNQRSARAKNAAPLSKAVIDYQAIYDTKSFGHGNTGHTFGDRLTADERAAVIEFLKSLSGPDM